MGFRLQETIYRQMAKREIIAVNFSDLHLETWKNHNEGNRRLKNAINVLKDIAMVCKKHDVPSLFGGDLFHKERALTNDIIEDTFPALYKIWGKGNFRTIGITGNHDQSKQNLIGKESPSYVRTLSKIFKGLECIDFSSYELNDKVIVHGVPYITHDLGLIEYINGIKLENSKKHILMIHTTMPNAKDTDGREVHTNLPDTEFYKALARFDLVLCGHIHSPCTWKIGKTTILQTGAPQQQRLTDKDCDMGYWLIYSDLSVEFVHLNKYPRFIEVESVTEKLGDGNFYVVKPKRVNKKTVQEARKEFNLQLSRTKLASNYCKQKGIKDKVKKEALVNTLKNTE